MPDLKRDAIKFVRDKAKSGYKKGTSCEICSTTENLDFHHYSGLTELFDKWLNKNKIKITCDDDVYKVRDKFIKLYNKELYIDTTTLCHEHHMKLHSVYGKRPLLSTAAKQMRWVEKQKVKYGLV